jgi:hypothetical protein
MIQRLRRGISGDVGGELLVSARYEPQVFNVKRLTDEASITLQTPAPPSQAAEMLADKLAAARLT